MEKIIQYMWQHRLWLPSPLKTVNGEPVEVLDPGMQNLDAGPDFFNAKVRIGNRTWAGNVEIHERASDWRRHGHDNDRAYDSIILHVVTDDDARIKRHDGSEIPQAVLPSALDFKKIYDRMTAAPACDLPCGAMLADIPALYRTDWLTSLAFERIHAKAEHMGEIMRRTGHEWRGAVYVLLARALGFGINGDAMERLALATPLQALIHHQGDIRAVESLMFGQAGFLDTRPAGEAEEKYLAALRQDYDFLRKKYNLKQPGDLGWKLARMRPQNFPYRRIAYLARMVCDGFGIAAELPSTDSIDAARRLFAASLGDFWTAHYSFSPAADRPGPQLSKRAVDILIINVVVTALYAYSKIYGDRSSLEKCVGLLQSLPPEDNRITRLFTAAGINCPDAFTSQALIQLRRCYCEPRKCLRCRFGSRLLNSRFRTR